MKPFSNDLRHRIIDRIQTNEESQPEIAEHFAVSLSFVEKLWSRFRSTGKFAALPHAGGRARSLKQDEDLIRQQIAEQPDATLEELAQKIAAQTGKSRVSATTISQELCRLNLPQKRMIHASERETERVQERRAEYQAEISAEIVGRLKFLDESGSNIAMTRLYGRAARGERVVEAVPQNYGSNITMLCAISLSGVSAPRTVSGAVDAIVFKTYVEQVLSPTLSVGDVVVMDNLPAHKVSGIKELIEGAGANLIYWPPYSPDLNPIEKCWSKIKTALRAAKARTRGALEMALKAALLTITMEDAAGWFECCGYPVHS